MCVPFRRVSKCCSTLFWMHRGRRNAQLNAGTVKIFPYPIKDFFFKFLLFSLIHKVVITSFLLFVGLFINWKAFHKEQIGECPICNWSSLYWICWQHDKSMCQSWKTSYSIGSTSKKFMKQVKPFNILHICGKAV